ncbi:hypothetical protein KJ742_01590, partial [Patescibacteria group bacterium]|nr:hypothetical protein [Patescibacteria group bacterium]
EPALTETQPGSVRFTPLDQGQYVISLLVMNGDELTDEAVAVIEVMSGVCQQQPIITFSPDLDGLTGVDIAEILTWNLDDPCGELDTLQEYEIEAVDIDGLYTPILTHQTENYAELSALGVMTEADYELTVIYVDVQGTEAYGAISFNTVSALPYTIALDDPSIDTFTVNEMVDLDITPANSYYDVYIGGTYYATDNADQYYAMYAGEYELVLTDDPQHSSVTFTVLSQAQAICYGPDLTEGTQDDVGYWYDNGCWILGAENQNCTNACVTATLTCATGDWNDDTSCTVCSELTGVENCSDDPVNYAPYALGTFFCRYRVNEPQDCTASEVSKTRICKCE